jgi:hypothetical protein
MSNRFPRLSGGSNGVAEQYRAAFAKPAMPLRVKLGIVALIATLLTIAFIVAGCSPHGQSPAAGNSSHVNLDKHPTPPSLKKTDTALDVLVWASIVGIGVAAALFFFSPATHALSIPIAGGAGAVLALSLFLKTTLWLIPWIAGALLIVGFLVFLYELYLKVRQQDIETPATPAVGGRGD